MPAYLFECEDCKEQWEQIFRMNEKKECGCPTCKKPAKRVFTVPNAQVKDKVDPFNIKELTAKTGKMKGTMGDLYDFSKEMSDKRAEKLGKDDPIRKRALEDYAKRRKGIKYKESTKKKEDATIEFKPR